MTTMKIAYFDCFSGISGDMMNAALIDAGMDENVLKKELSKLNIKDVEITTKKVVKQNIASTQFFVNSQEQTHHRHLKHLNEIVDSSDLDTNIKSRAKKVFLKIAEAEAKIHNMPLEKVHFHEVGAIDTIFDVVGAMISIEHLGIEKVYCSPMNVGSGFVTFSHGKFPVPAPATAEILKGVPTFSTDSQAELVTPTGAAIITTLAEKFGNMPTFIQDSVGYGAGTKDLEQPNVLRVYLGHMETAVKQNQDTVTVIEANIDDMNPQMYDFVFEKLLQNGALDVYLTNIIMKKNRPAIKITVLAHESDADKLTKILFQETTTIGVRTHKENRTILSREIIEKDTKYGTVRIKVSRLNGDIVNTMPEYEDVKKIAQKTGISLKKLYDEL